MKIVMENMIQMGFSHEHKGESFSLSLLGIGIAKINLNTEKVKIIYQMGIGFPMIQNVIELDKIEMLEKKRGNSIIPVENFTIFTNYFQHKEDVIVIIYMDEKESDLSYAKLYILTKKISNVIRLNPKLSTLKMICNNSIKIPKASGLMGVLMIGTSGSPLYSKIRKDCMAIEEKEVHISGFISALTSFSKEIMGKNSGSELKDINFGDKRIYMINKNEVIFAYLVEELNPLLERYMYIIPDEFIHKYKESLIDFSGDLTPFYSFEENINQYLILDGCE